jgi:NAD(P)-dependent dehydrogenase (short-subunit alcohol dehydrogenase family)
MDLGLGGKSVVVTGGNRGIGRGIALAFAGEGANVAIVGRDSGALAAVRDEIEALGVKALAIEADLFTAQGCIRVADDTAAAFGGLDVLVNNASTAVSGQLESLSDDQLMERLNGKTLAYMRCCRAALPWLREAGTGRIVCIGGLAARAAAKMTLPSGLGNAALCNFVKHFSNDVAADGITVNVVHPPFTKTDRYPARLAARAAERGLSLEDAEATFVADFPIGRLIEPGDIAPMVLFLASPHAAAITGQAIGVDGGSSPDVSY